MNNPVIYFEIPVRDLDRAITFWSVVFGYVFERADIDGNAMALFPFADDVNGITGALAQGDSYTPGKQGVRLYFVTDDIDVLLTRAVNAAGQIPYVLRRLRISKPITPVVLSKTVSDFSPVEAA